MQTDTSSETEVIIACDPNALTVEEQEYWVKEIVPKLYKEVQEIQELPDGWAWRLPSKSEVLRLVAEDLNMERLCCPFVNYTLEIPPNRGPFWLRMTGVEGVKEFLRMSFESGNYFDAEVAQAAGIHLAASPEIDSVQTAMGAVDTLNERYAQSVRAKDNS
jgi:hypothetical protein